MTIIEPKKKKSKFLIFTPILALVVFGVYANISLYNSIVDSKHELKKRERELEQLAVESAELKNRLYALFDAAAMKETVGEFGLILDKNPSYLELPAPELARTYLTNIPSRDMSQFLRDQEATTKAYPL